jgi:hypothetical protein
MKAAVSVTKWFRRRSFQCIGNNAPSTADWPPNLGAPVLTKLDFDKDYWGYILTAIVGMLVAYLPTTFVEKFYLRDDMQHYHMPTFVHMGELLRQGEFPFISLSAWHGGNLLGEHQNALFNPVSLITYYLLPSAPDYSQAATALAIFYYAIFATGIYALCRSYGANKNWSFLAGVVAVTNPFIVYYFSQSWFAVFISTCWLSWAWALLARATRSRGYFVAAVIACYLTITAGWPQTTLVLALLAGLIAIDTWKHRGWRIALLPLAAAGCAALMSAPALLPLLSLKEVSSRAFEFSNRNFLVPSLGDALSVSAPFYRGFISWWGGYILTPTPHFYVAWFMLPLLPFINWAKMNWRSSGLFALLAATTLFFVALRGPENFGPLRWSIRFLPLFQLSVLVVFIVISSKVGFTKPSGPRRLVSLAIILFLVVGTMQATPRVYGSQLLVGLVMTLAVYLAVRLNGRPQIVFLTAVTLLFSTVNFVLYPALFDIWSVPTKPANVRTGSGIPTSYLFNDSSIAYFPDPSLFQELQYGQIPLNYGRSVINGHTPIGHVSFEKTFCMQVQGQTCEGGGRALLVKDPSTNVLLADLMRVDTIVVQKGNRQNLLAAVMGPEWKCDTRKWTASCSRPLPNATLPGNLSYVTPGTQVDAVGKPSLLRETVSIKSNDAAKLVFARLYWPGYKFFLDGKQLPLIRHLGFLVSVDVPAGANGSTLSLIWHPPFFRIGLMFAALGLLIASVTAFKIQRREAG